MKQILFTPQTKIKYQNLNCEEDFEKICDSHKIYSTIWNTNLKQMTKQSFFFNFYWFFKNFHRFFFNYLLYRGRLPYCKILYKRKLISIKKWFQSTDYKKVSVLWSPFMYLSIFNIYLTFNVLFTTQFILQISNILFDIMQHFEKQILTSTYYF